MAQPCNANETGDSTCTAQYTKKRPLTKLEKQKMDGHTFLKYLRNTYGSYKNKKARGTDTAIEDKKEQRVETFEVAINFLNDSITETQEALSNANDTASNSKRECQAMSSNSAIDVDKQAKHTLSSQEELGAQVLQQPGGRNAPQYPWMPYRPSLLSYTSSEDARQRSLRIPDLPGNLYRRRRGVYPTWTNKYTSWTNRYLLEQVLKPAAPVPPLRRFQYSEDQITISDIMVEDESLFFNIIAGGRSYMLKIVSCINGTAVDSHLIN